MVGNNITSGKKVVLGQKNRIFNNPEQLWKGTTFASGKKIVLGQNS